jgi:hypothetical protein
MPKRDFVYKSHEGTSSAEKRRKIEYETGQTSAARATKLEMTACECLRMQEHGVTVH